MRTVLLLLFISTALHARIIFWHSMTGEKVKLINGFVSDYNAKPENRDYPVIAQFVGSYEDGINKVRTALIAKRPPHLIQVAEIGTQVIVDTKQTVPLGELIKNDPEFPLDQMMPAIRRYYEQDGVLVALPFATSNPTLYYNVEWLKRAGLSRPPETLDEMVEWSRKLSNPKEKKTGMTWPLHSWFFEQFTARLGQPLVNNENGRNLRANESFLDSKAGVKFANLWKSMTDEGIFAQMGRNWEPAEQNFLAGQSAMLITSTSDIFLVSEKATFPVLTAPLPGIKGITGGTIIGGNSVWILKGKPPAEQAAAYKFVKYLASKEVQRTWHTKTGYFPIRKDLIADLEKEGFYKKYPAARTAIDQLLNCPDVTATRGALLGSFPELRENIETAIEKILAHKETAEEALKEAKLQTDGAIQRYNRGR